MDMSQQLNIMEWISDFQMLSSRRMLGHQLNNHMTPLAMHVSLVKQQLQAGNSNKAIERLEKLERAVLKLKSFSLELFDAKESVLNKVDICSNAELKDLLNQFLLLPGFRDIELGWDLCKFDNAISLDAKIIALFLYAYLYDNKADKAPANCSIISSVDDQLDFCLTLHYQSRNTQSTEPFEAVISTSALSQLAKLIKSETNIYSLSGNKSFNSPWVLSAKFG